MENVTNLLTPAQIDAILSVYGTISSWYAQAVDFIVLHANSIVIEDIYM